jgi:hypothetical protein
MWQQPQVTLRCNQITPHLEQRKKLAELLIAGSESRLCLRGPPYTQNFIDSFTKRIANLA